MQVMERPGVRSETNGPVTTIILDRPARRNAVDPPTAAALRAAFRAFERDREARVAVLWGAHGTFCAGFDLKAFAAAPPRHPRAYGEGPMGPTRMRLAKPVIAAVSGYAVAGGLELALWCDLRVVEEDAIMGIFNRRWGVPLVDGGTVRLPAVVAFPPNCVRSDRQSAYESVGARLVAALRREHALGMRSAATGESREGATRFA